MKKFKFLITMILMVIFASKIQAAKNLSEYFTVDNVKLCEDIDCNVEYVEYSKTNGSNKVCMKGDYGNYFYVIFDWNFDYSQYEGSIEPGDYIEIPYLNNVQTATQPAFIGSVVSNAKLSVMNSQNQEIEIGKWGISGASIADRKLKIVFNNGINDSYLSKNISGSITSLKNTYATLTYNVATDSSADVYATIGSKSIKFCNTYPSLSESLGGFSLYVSSKSNQSINWATSSNSDTIKKVYELYSGDEVSSISQKPIYNELKLKYKIDKTANVSNFAFYVRFLLPVSIPENISNLKMSARSVSLNITPFYFEKDENPENTYSSLDNYIEDIEEKHYGIYTDLNDNTQTLIVNFGSQPSIDLTYKEVVEKQAKNCEEFHCSLAEYEKSYAPYTFNNERLLKIVDDIYSDSERNQQILNDYFGAEYDGGNILQWQMTYKVTYNVPVLKPTEVETHVDWIWTDENGTSQSMPMTTESTLNPASVLATTKGVVNLALYDEDDPTILLDGIKIGLMKCENSTCNLVQTKETNSKGIVTFSGLEDGTYKFIQDSTIENNYKLGYQEGLKVYNNLNIQTGVFSNELENQTFDISGEGLILYGTNKRQEFTIKYLPGTKGTFDPVEYKILYNDSLKTFRPANENEWIFDGWIDEEGQKYSPGLVTENKTYTATWHKNVTVTTTHHDKDTGLKISGVDDIPDTKWNGTPYSTTHVNPNEILKNYDYVDYTITPSGKTPSGNDRGEEDITVTYNYRIKKANINISYVNCKNDNCTSKEEITHQTVENKPYLTSYTAPLLNSSDFPEYIAFDVSNRNVNINYTTVSNGKINIELKYKKKDSNIVVEGETTSTKEIITEVGQTIDYTVKGIVTYTNYRGESVVAMTHTLPYKIDVSKSELDGGEYNEENNTITWEDTKNIDSFINENGVLQDTITKSLNLYYTGKYEYADSIDNSTKVSVDAEEKDNIETTVGISIPVDVKGKITVKYIDENGNEIYETIENNEKVGIKYTPVLKEKEGYKIVSTVKDEYEYSVEDQVLEYKYERLKYNINVTSNEGGDVEGKEVVYYGEDSKENNIKIKAKEGYIIDVIKINGEEIDIPENSEELVLPQFISVKEDKNIEVILKKKVDKAETPITGIKKYASIILSAILIILGLITVIIFRKKKNK